MNRLMLDFETLDIAECPVILSMGAVVFNENGIVDCFFEKIDQHSCLDLGCTVSVDTLLWWEEQSDAAKKAAFGGTTNIGYAMSMLVDLYKKHACEEIWSKGAIADIRWANNILDKLGLQKPWKFWEEMCFRTYLKYSPKVDFQPVGEAHNALDDATNQAKHWIEINNQRYLNSDIFCEYLAEMGNIFTTAKDSLQSLSSHKNGDNISDIYIKTKEDDRLDIFIQDILNNESISIDEIKTISTNKGFECELIGGDESHGSYSIYRNANTYIVSITKCKCGHIHLLEDMCVMCNPVIEDNYLGNGTPVQKIVLDDNELPF